MRPTLSHMRRPPGLTTQVGFIRPARLSDRNRVNPISGGPSFHARSFYEQGGLPGHKRVYARLQRAMPSNDGAMSAQDRLKSALVHCCMGARAKVIGLAGRRQTKSAAYSSGPGPMALVQ